MKGRPHVAIVMTADEALRALQEGTAPPGLHVEGSLHWFERQRHWYRPGDVSRDTLGPPRLPADCFIEKLWIGGIRGDIVWPPGFRCTELWITQCPDVTTLPSHQTVRELFVRDSPALTALPDDFVVTGQLTLSECPGLTHLPSGIRVSALSLRDCPQLQALPADMQVLAELAVQDCPNLAVLPERIEALQINVAGCRNLRRLPQGIQAHYVDFANCTALEAWDDPTITSLRQLDARGYRNLRQLPPNLREIDQLDVSGCELLADLPPDLSVREWLDIGGTQIRTLPQTDQPFRLRWNGVHVSGRIAFHPETITAAMILGERNVEVRRVMVERVGLERLLAETTPTVFDHDTDPGGPRRLLALTLPRGDEPVVVLHVQDPSTGRQYFIRVPPTMRTCHQAAAWIAGFDDPAQYRPVAET